MVWECRKQPCAQSASANDEGSASSGWFKVKQAQAPSRRLRVFLAPSALMVSHENTPVGTTTEKTDIQHHPHMLSDP
jgi:hypothetical protein